MLVELKFYFIIGVKIYGVVILVKGLYLILIFLVLSFLNENENFFVDFIYWEIFLFFCVVFV